MLPRWVRRALRLRVVRLSFVVLPQIICLAILACLFYFMRVQEAIVVPAVPDRGSVTPLLRCTVRPEQITGVPAGTPVHVDLLREDDQIMVSGDGAVQSLASGSKQSILNVAGSGLSAVVRQAEGMASPRVRIHMRVRRVLDTVTAKGDLFK